MKSFFEVFDLPVSYRINESELTEKYFEKQRLLHIGKNNLDCENDISYLNEAYKTLLNSVDRATYIIKLHGGRLDEVSSESASEMFEIREKYSLLLSEDAKKKYQVFLNQRMSEIMKLLCEVDESSKEFYEYTCLLRFIQAFLEKIGINVYCRN